MKKILVPVDGSEPAKRACRVAKDLALKYGSDIILVTVVSTDEFAARELGEELGHKYREEFLSLRVENAKKMLLEIKKDFEGMVEKVETRCLEGNVANEILACANREQADMIVMGSRGMGLVSRAFLGSISNKVVNHSEISVLIVK